MSTFPETLGLGQVISRELKEEIEHRYNTYAELEQQLAAKETLLLEMRTAIAWIKHQTENQRVWGGMEWHYPFPHQRIFNKAEEVIAAIDKELGK